MQKFKKSLLFFSVLFSVVAGAQPVIIAGTASSYKGQEIVANSFKDLITYTPLKVGACIVDDSGRFSIQLADIKTSQYLYVSIGNQQGSIYVSPGNTYHVIFPEQDSTQYENPYTTHSIDLTFIVNDSDNINNLIIDFNDQFDEFWKQDYVYFVKKEGPHYLDSFYVSMQHHYANIKNSYFKAYIEYNLAEIGINIMEGTKTLGEKYLKNKPVLYHNYEYMKFFNDYFNGYLEQLALTTRGADISNYINGGNYQDLLDVLKINPLLKTNDSLCSLVLLKGLYDLYYGESYYQKSIKALLTSIASQSNIEENKIIANDMLHSFSEVSNGAGSPDFALKDSKGIVNSILDFRGKYLYLSFYKSNSDQCLSELSVVASLAKKYGKKINFVSISEDKNINEMQHFLEQNKIFTWPFLYDDGGKILEKYDVKSLPEFFLINPQGKFFLSPADAPSHGIELIFDKLLERKKPNNQ